MNNNAVRKVKARKECLRWVRAIKKTELNVKNKLKAINTSAILVTIYSFNVINWNLEEIRRIDNGNLQLCITFTIPKTDADCLCLPRLMGGERTDSTKSHLHRT